MGIYSKQAGEVSGRHMSMDAIGMRLHQNSRRKKQPLMLALLK